MDEARFESLVRRHKDSVYRQMARVCGHKEDAEDALAQALMLAFRSADQLQTDEAFRGWIGTIGKRVCARMRHRPVIQEALEFAEQRGLIAQDASEMEVSVLKGCVQDAIGSLPEGYRAVYELCELEECTVPEAAQKLGISVAAAKSRLLRARAMMRQTLDGSICGT